MALTSSFKGNFVNNTVQGSTKGKSQHKMIVLCEDHPGPRLGSSQSTEFYIGDSMNDTLSDGSILLRLVEALITDKGTQSYSNTNFSPPQLRLLTFLARLAIWRQMFSLNDTSI